MTKKQHAKKKTVGAHAVDRMQHAPETRDPIELQRETEKGYIDALKKCVIESRPKYPGNFYVTVISKNEKLLYNVIRCYFFDRATCPTPDYDQTVFVFEKDKETIEHLWTVPDKESCLVYLREREKVVPEEYPILNNILRFKSGDLFKLCKKLNNEEADSPLLIS